MNRTRGRVSQLHVFRPPTDADLTLIVLAQETWAFCDDFDSPDAPTVFHVDAEFDTQSGAWTCEACSTRLT